jgi:molybdate-binding protein
VPSAAAALVLAEALGCRVEDLFRVQRAGALVPSWAWAPRSFPSRFWKAEVGGVLRLFPTEAGPLGTIPHDGVAQADGIPEMPGGDPRRTLVLAGCDPAVGLLAAELERTAAVRLIVLPRPSAAALALLAQGLVHGAGVHLSRADAPGGNAEIVRAELGPGYSLLRIAKWEEGIALAGGRRWTSLRSAVRADMEWVGREPGSGARQCQDELLGSRHEPRRLAFDHRGVAAAVRGGLADAGICLRLASEEAGLSFLSVRHESYDLCFPTASRHELRIEALVQAVRSPAYQRVLGELPGYDVASTGELDLID